VGGALAEAIALMNRNRAAAQRVAVNALTGLDTATFGAGVAVDVDVTVTLAC
jgi:hypothetical protein